MHDLSVVISTYNGLDKLKLTLAAYRNQTHKNFEIIIAADGSNQETLDFISSNKKNYPYQLKCVWHKDEGFRLARIRNCGWRIAESNRVIFTDHDIVPNADCLSNYLKYSDHDLALTGYIGWINEEIHSLFSEENIGKIDRFEPFMSEPEKRNFRKYDWQVVWGGNCSFTKDIYDKTGGFDEEFIGWGGEDTDLALRCQRGGWLIKTVAEAKMFHLNHQPGNSLNRTGSDLYYKHKRHDRTIRRNLDADYSDVITI